MQNFSLYNLHFSLWRGNSIATLYNLLFSHWIGHSIATLFTLDRSLDFSNFVQNQFANFSQLSSIATHFHFTIYTFYFLLFATFPNSAQPSCTHSLTSTSLYNSHFSLFTLDVGLNSLHFSLLIGHSIATLFTLQFPNSAQPELHSLTNQQWRGASAL